ncbi:N-acetylmuramoyl-L-alanine amidase family protein [Phenylobacterium immobile]|uniref:N-acetylmuramoyl-L-alanine amidase family protein n=1 Tax=Phenylobacterium immobile TaxID=21 RepID=UPI000AF7A5E9|nr:N-acetylmuramoyl-L-alanine amidase [Phenylobacterium immobile]
MRSKALRALGAMAVVLGGLGAFAGSSAAISQATVLRVRVGGDQAQTRIVLDLDRSVVAKLSADGYSDQRLVLSLPGARAADGLQGGRQGLVKAWLIDHPSSGARLQIDLAAGATVARRFLLPPADGVEHYRYVVDLIPQGAAPREVAPTATFTAYEKAVAKGRSPEQAAGKAMKIAKGSTKSRPLSLKKVVVIDAGHGGHDPGARGAKGWEKDINLAAALALKDRLEGSGRYKVVMTRDSDAYVPLDSRVRIAQRANADLFISLHSDSGPDANVSGASVYTLSDQASARAQKFVTKDDWFMKASLARGGVSDILFDLTQRATRNRSAAFAQMLVAEIEPHTNLLRRSHRDAGFMVLLAPNVPAVLLEMGFVTNGADEALLRDPRRRGRLMDAVGDSIDSYFAETTRLATR